MTINVNFLYNLISTPKEQDTIYYYFLNYPSPTLERVFRF